MKTIVIYKSISGFSQKYAEWIAKEIHADIFSLKEINGDMLQKYDLIVFGGALHAATINGLSAIKRLLPTLHNKHFIVFATGAGPEKPNVLDEIQKANFNTNAFKNIRFYYLRGGFDYQKLPFGYKIAMTIFKRLISLKREKSPDEKGMLEAFNRPVDFTKKEYIQDMITYIKNL